ncbi:MAG: hypothetical protein AAF432_06545 [Planctomycetota bacterium]
MVKLSMRGLIVCVAACCATDVASAGDPPAAEGWHVEIDVPANVIAGLPCIVDVGIVNTYQPPAPFPWDAAELAELSTEEQSRRSARLFSTINMPVYGMLDPQRPPLSADVRDQAGNIVREANPPGINAFYVDGAPVQSKMCHANKRSRKYISTEFLRPHMAIAGDERQRISVDAAPWPYRLPPGDYTLTIGVHGYGAIYDTERTKPLSVSEPVPFTVVAMDKHDRAVLSQVAATAEDDTHEHVSIDLLLAIDQDLTVLQMILSDAAWDAIAPYAIIGQVERTNSLESANALIAMLTSDRHALLRETLTLESMMRHDTTDSVSAFLELRAEDFPELRHAYERAVIGEGILDRAGERTRQ